MILFKNDVERAAHVRIARHSSFCEQHQWTRSIPAEGGAEGDLHLPSVSVPVPFKDDGWDDVQSLPVINEAYQIFRAFKETASSFHVSKRNPPTVLVLFGALFSSYLTHYDESNHSDYLQ